MALNRQNQRQIVQLMFGSYINRQQARKALRKQGFPEPMLRAWNRKGELKTGMTADHLTVLSERRGVDKYKLDGMSCPPDCPPYLGNWKTSIEAAFGPVTTFVSNLMLPDQSKASITIEVQQANRSKSFGHEFSAKTQFDAVGRPVGFINTSTGIQEHARVAGPYQVTTDSVITTRSLDTGKFSGELQYSKSGFERASVQEANISGPAWRLIIREKFRQA